MGLLNLPGLMYEIMLNSGQKYPWSLAAIGESKARGMQIVGAIDTWAMKNGSPPSSLDDLVPDYISDIEPPTAGEGEWKYASPSFEGYELSFSRGNYGIPTIVYDSSQRAWIERD